MGENTHISWADHTFNPWYGCTKLSPACAHCYAETLMDTRYGKVKWGPGQPRVRTSAENWKLPLRWSREAAAAETNPRVFCASLADWLDDDGVPVEWLADLLALIHATPHLIWMLLTKRPENFRGRMTAAFHHAFDVDGDNDLSTLHNWISAWFQAGTPPPNVWIGVTAENQEWADRRVPLVQAIPARVRFLSCEPLLGPILLNGLNDGKSPGIHWVIAGGESGGGARPMRAEWALTLRDTAKMAGCAFHFKQWGAHDATGQRTGVARAGRLLDGEEWNEVPA